MRENSLAEVCFFAWQHVSIMLAPGGTCYSGSSLYRWHVGETVAAGRGGWVGPCYSRRTLFCSQQETMEPQRERPSQPLGIAAGLNTQMAIGCYLFILPLCRDGRDGAAYRLFLFLASIVICCTYFLCKSGKLFSLSY